MRDVLLPLALTWALGTAVVSVVGNHFAAQAFDRALLDDAHALAAHVHHDQGRPEVRLSPEDLRTLLFDQNESVYFAVFDAAGERLAGNAALRPTGSVLGEGHAFSDQTLAGQALRVVELRLGEAAGVRVLMAQTTTVRSRLLGRLLASSVLVQLGLLGGLALWLRRRIRHDLAPLAELQQAVEQRDASELAPLPARLAGEAPTRDVQHLGEAVNSLFERLQASLRAQQEFAGNVAHELRTPLAGIRAQAGDALASSDPAVWHSELQGIARAEQRASRLVDQLLALARAAEGSTGLQLAPLALDALVREVVLRCMPRARALGVDLGAEGLDDPVVVRADRALLEGILNNLIDNALRYGRSAAPEVTVSLQQRGAEVQLTVRDQGPGLGALPVPALTGRWSQGPLGQGLGLGAGLGLAIVARYAELLGARLDFGPGPDGIGLSASIRLPAVEAD